MSTLVCVVEDVFQIDGWGGCVIVPGLPKDSSVPARPGDAILLKRPDGSELETTLRGIPTGGRRELAGIPVLLAVADKAEIPVGTEVWLV